MSEIKLKYFVLKPRGSDAYAKASRTALRVFSTEMEQDDPALAAQLKRWAYDEERAAHREGLDEATR